MKLLVLGTGLAIFAAVALAVRYHFVAGATRGRFLLLAALTAVNIFVFGRELWLRQKDFDLLAVALGLFVVAGGLFAATMQASRAARLKLIFEPDNPQFILRSGPYRFIRHPFYASYVVYWLGCAVATLHPINIGYVLLVVPLLVMSAREEEKGFERSPHAADYQAYRRQAGLFWPKF